ncbi:MAG: transcription termination/antitermination NusG family protein [Lacipirellulaceae bacterium]
MLKLEDNPPLGYSSLSGEDALGAADWDQTWHIAYTKPRQEKALAWDLRTLGVTYFLPMLERETSSGGRRRHNLYPIFPSYFFFGGGEEQRVRVLRTQRTVGGVPVTETQQPLLRRELASLEVSVRTAPRSIELHARVVVGARVIVKSGPMRGIEGVVLDAGDKRKLWIGVSALGTGITVQIPADLVDVF